MLYHVLWPLRDHWIVFNVFRYITFRTALAAMTALLLSFALGGWLIRKLRDLQIGQEIRPEGPAAHAGKKGTPTMGGLLILAAVFVPVLLWADLGNRFLWIALGSTFLFGAIGFVDDYLKLSRRRSLGLTVRRKLLAQTAVAAGVGIALVWLAGQGQFQLELAFPFFKRWTPDLGWFYVPFAVLVVVGS
ncbi:MAG: phospho-N-acetylmuramoyl-pentapeptide-transferase, partial [Acidobacteria bacterium]|nr:phospho-N-acetylmuramoyl-pentapeptide-transferase [Acidobacteriota bacterium]